jgi:hypothetical protein
VSPEHTARPWPVAASLTRPGPGGGARDQRKLETLTEFLRQPWPPGPAVSLP